jgi:hypothetical protein
MTQSGNFWIHPRIIPVDGRIMFPVTEISHAVLLFVRRITFLKLSLLKLELKAHVPGFVTRWAIGAT